MPRQTSSPEEIVKKLRRAELVIAQGETVSAAAKAAGISRACYHTWRREYGGMNAAQVKRVIELKRENAHLRNLTSELSHALVWQPKSTL